MPNRSGYALEGVEGDIARDQTVARTQQKWRKAYVGLLSSIPEPYKSRIIKPLYRALSLSVDVGQGIRYDEQRLKRQLRKDLEKRKAKM